MHAERLMTYGINLTPRHSLPAQYGGSCPLCRSHHGCPGASGVSHIGAQRGPAVSALRKRGARKGAIHLGGPVEPARPELLAPGRQRPARAGHRVAVHLPQVALPCAARAANMSAYDSLGRAGRAHPARCTRAAAMKPHSAWDGRACTGSARAGHLPLHQSDRQVARQQLMRDAQAYYTCFPKARVRLPLLSTAVHLYQRGREAPPPTTATSTVMSELACATAQTAGLRCPCAGPALLGCAAV